tara:strand:- start:1545 stop:3131 length:1587 start_codon:yes stop_codon:yes gene_type:complete
MSKIPSWNYFQQHCLQLPELGMSIDISRMNAPDKLTDSLQEKFRIAFRQMTELENGSIANNDENQMVGHYWLRNADLAPTEKIRNQIKNSLKKIKQFAEEIHQKTIKPQKAKRFRNVLSLGMGGSALGPQLIYSALGLKNESLQFYFIDNTDPDGIDRAITSIGKGLAETLTLIISKSGGTLETRNAMLEVQECYNSSGLDFAKHAVAITLENSHLAQLASNENWLGYFPVWEWVGGRTSILSTVGLLPAALLGENINNLLSGAKIMDELTRSTKIKENPAAVLAWMLHHAGGGRGKKAMVMLPYKDRLIYLSPYLQQLVMESVGKEKDLKGNTVNHGLTVYGSKGSTDQHSIGQQLRDGPNDFFVAFIEVLKDRENLSIEVEPEVTSGDFLQGFLIGTRDTLFQKGRASLTITLEELNPRSLGALIALFERAVGLYANLIGLNAYHQPGVEAGKLAAGYVIKLSVKIQNYLNSNPGQKLDTVTISDAIGESEKTETVYKILQHLAANQRVLKIPGKDQFSSLFQACI